MRDPGKRAAGAAAAVALTAAAMIAVAAVPEPPTSDARDAGLLDAGLPDGGGRDSGGDDAATVTPADDEYAVVDEPAPPPAYVAELRRSGRLAIGFDVGVGRFDAVCDGCASQGGLSLALSLGVQVTPRLALMLDVWSVQHLLPADAGGEGGVAGHSQAAVAARSWLAPRLWLQGGLGLGGFHVSGQAGGLDLGPTVSAALGHEVLHRPYRGVDIALRVGATSIKDLGERLLFYSVAAVAAFHWN